MRGFLLSALLAAVMATSAWAAPRFSARLPDGTAMEIAEFAVTSNPDSPADASVGTIAYVGTANSPDQHTARPLLFAFNGGPGSSSAYLHMGLLGPLRAAIPQNPRDALPDRAPLVANAESLLGVADVVLLDPPGTGYARLQPGADRARLQSVKGDAAAMAQAVVAWLDAHGRREAPVYLLGESYGTIRAAAMIAELKTRAPWLQLRGVLLLGQALNMIETSQRPANVVTWPVNLPTLAAVACWHAVPTRCDPGAAADAARAFGPDYLDGLYRGRDLDPERQQALAHRLQALTGLAADGWVQRRLTLSKEDFRLELLKGRGEVLARYDARYTGGDAGSDAFAPVAGLYGKAVVDRLTQLGVPGDYRLMARPEGPWAYGGGDSPFADWPFMAMVEKAMADDPQFRLFIGTGLYDLTTTVGAADYLVAHTRADRARIVNRRYEAGHMTYSDDTARKALSADIRAFLAGAAR